MQTRTLIVTFAGAGSQDLPGGTFLFIKAASAALDIIITDQNGTQSTLSQVGAGARLRRPQTAPWRFTRLTSAAAQVVTVIVSDEAEFDVANTVTVSGSVTTAESPSASFTTPAFDTILTGASLDIAANPARRRITITALSTNSDSVYVRDQSGTGAAGIELQSGQSAELCTTAAIRVQNNTAASQIVLRAEEA